MSEQQAAECNKRAYMQGGASQDHSVGAGVLFDFLHKPANQALNLLFLASLRMQTNYELAVHILQTVTWT